MTRYERKMVLRIWNLWIKNRRVSYAELLRVAPAGKILSAFEHIAADKIDQFHSAEAWDDVIDWSVVQSYIYREMESLALFQMRVNDRVRDYYQIPESLSRKLTEEELEELKRVYQEVVSHAEV